MISGGPDERPERRPTAADVGVVAGVSRATVGYVLNDVPGQSIPESTRDRVRAAAAQLGYTPSAAARALRAGRSEIVLCLIPDWPIGAAFTAQMTALSAQLEARGFTFLTHPHSVPGRPLAEVLRAVTPAVVLALSALSESDARVLADARIRVVPFGAGRPRGEAAGRAIGRLQAEHLIAVGCRRLAFAFPTDDRIARAFGAERRRGALEAAAEAGVPMSVDAVDFDAAGFDAAVLAWSESGVTGVCCYNDEYAAGVLAAATARGIAVPSRLAIVGVDDDPLSAVLRPGITSVALDHESSAADLAELLLDERGAAGGPHLALVVRGSTDGGAA